MACSLARVKGAVAAQEISKITSPARRKHLELAEAGKVSGGGPRPFGYEKDRITIRPDEAEEVRAAVDRLLHGDSLRAIAGDWNARSITTTLGNGWRSQTLRQVLVAARISGERSHHGAIVGDAVWPGLISKTDGARLRALLKDPSRNKRGAPVRHLLTGFLRCGKCEKHLVAHRSHDRPTYECHGGPGLGCGELKILAVPLEKLITDAVLQRLDTPALAMAMARRNAQSDIHTLIESIAADRDQLNELAVDWANRKVTKIEWATARQVVETRLEAAERSLARSGADDTLQALVGHSGALLSVWADLGTDRQRSIIGAVVDRIVIAPSEVPGVHFDLERIDIIWKF